LRQIDHQPNAASIINSMRAHGYTFEAAVADIFDNSLAASSKNLRLEVRRDPTYVAFIDDGTGMSETQLIEAMRFGSRSPLERRDVSDHGRFSLGLKTASLSQCRRLTVVTKQNSIFSAAQWDLDHVEKTNSWCLTVLDEDQIPSIPCFSSLSAQQSGTVVIWERFDRLGTPEDSPTANETLVRLVSESAEALSLIYHRFLDGSAGRLVRAWVNGTTIEPADPYFSRNSFTRVVGREHTLIDGHPISAVAYILPQLINLSPSELKAAGGVASLKDHQGFFLYRNFRLITYGTWFRLAPREDLTRLARISVDVDNSIDHEWQLDIKKSTALPSQSARLFLSSMVHFVTNESVRRFVSRASASQLASNQSMWIRKLARDKVTFEINRTHPLITRVVNTMSELEFESFDYMLHSLEMSLPLKQINLDQASRLDVGYDDEATAIRLKRLLESLLIGLSEAERRALASDLPNLEPFRSHPTLTEVLLGARNARQ
jgi:hypothetical protein